MFANCPRSSLVKEGVRKENWISHRLIQNSMSESDRLEDFSIKYNSLYANRTDADYNMESMFSLKDAQDAITDAESLISEISGQRLGEALSEYILKIHPD